MEHYTVDEEVESVESKTPRADRRMSDSRRLSVDAALPSAHHRPRSSTGTKPIGRKARIVLP